LIQIVLNQSVYTPLIRTVLKSKFERGCTCYWHWHIAFLLQLRHMSNQPITTDRNNLTHFIFFYCWLLFLYSASYIYSFVIYFIMFSYLIATFRKLFQADFNMRKGNMKVAGYIIIVSNVLQYLFKTLRFYDINCIFCSFFVRLLYQYQRKISLLCSMPNAMLITW
jgi:hypothetical protein